jgi:hypothetical protein
MPAEPPRSAVHQVQHLIYDGCRILRTRAAETLAPETIAALDAMLAELEPIEGFPIQPVDATAFVATLTKVEQELRAAYEKEIAQGQ